METPRGTLTHHCVTDERGIVTDVNLIVGTTDNNAPICIAIKRVAQGAIRRGEPVTDGPLNRIEVEGGQAAALSGGGQQLLRVAGGGVPTPLGADS